MQARPRSRKMFKSLTVSHVRHIWSNDTMHVVLFSVQPAKRKRNRVMLTFCLPQIARNHFDEYIISFIFYNLNLTYSASVPLICGPPLVLLSSPLTSCLKWKGVLSWKPAVTDVLFCWDESNRGLSQLCFAFGISVFCLWHVCAVHVGLKFQHVPRSDRWFDFSAVLVGSLSSCTLKELMTPACKLWGKAKTLSLVVFSFYLPFCQPLMPTEQRLWAVGCFFIIDSRVGVFYLSLCADA